MKKARVSGVGLGLSCLLLWNCTGSGDDVAGGGAGAGGPDASGPGDASANADGSPVGGGSGPCKLPLDGFKFNGKALEPSVFVARREGKLVGLGCSGTTAAPGFLAVYRFDCTTAEVTETRTALPCGSAPEESYAGFGRPLTARDTWLVSHNTYDKSTSPPEQREATVEVNLKGEVGFRIPRPVLADGEGKLWALPNNGATGGVVNKSAEVYAPDGTPLTLSAASRARLENSDFRNGRSGMAKSGVVVAELRPDAGVAGNYAFDLVTLTNVTPLTSPEGGSYTGISGDEWVSYRIDQSSGCQLSATFASIFTGAFTFVGKPVSYSPASRCSKERQPIAPFRAGGQVYATVTTSLAPGLTLPGLSDVVAITQLIRYDASGAATTAKPLRFQFVDGDELFAEETVGGKSLLTSRDPNTLELLAPKVAPPDLSKVDCSDKKLYSALPQDVQVTTLCAEACTYSKDKASAAAQNPASQAELQKRIDGACGVLRGYGSGYDAACPFCTK